MCEAIAGFLPQTFGPANQRYDTKVRGQLLPATYLAAQGPRLALSD
jgi:hypothetical protein